MTEQELNKMRKIWGAKGGKAKVPKGFAKNKELASQMGKQSKRSKQ